MPAIQIENHGPLITSTTYWESEYASEGKVIVSPNAGSIRCLLPPAMYPVIGELRQAEYAVVSVGPWRGMPAVEILWEDHTESPHAWHLTADSCLMIPGDPGPQQWTIACWVHKRGQPHKSLERPCHWRRVNKLPCLKPWDVPDRAPEPPQLKAGNNIHRLLRHGQETVVVDSQDGTEYTVAEVAQAAVMVGKTNGIEAFNRYLDRFFPRDA
jgi:hypothetical protein